MLLLDVRVEIASAHEDALNEWYHLHVPRLLSFPGYVSGRRYIRLSDGPKYAALYEIVDPSYVPCILGADPEQRVPLTLREWAEWDARFVPHAQHTSTNLYSAFEERDLLIGDLPLVEVRFDTFEARETSVLEYCHRELLPAVRHLSGVKRASRLFAPDDPALAWLNTRPRNLLLIQVADVDTAVALVSHAVFQQLGDLAEAFEIVAYSQIARHWPFYAEAANDKISYVKHSADAARGRVGGWSEPS
jgi:hypothetical protein